MGSGNKTLKPLCHGCAGPWVAGLGRNLRQRDERKGALGEPRVWNFEPRLAHGHAVHEQDIQIERARAIGDGGRAVAAELALQAEQRLEQRARGEIGFERDGGIEKARLGGETDRRGGVERGAGGDAAQAIQAARRLRPVWLPAIRPARAGLLPCRCRRCASPSD